MKLDRMELADCTTPDKLLRGLFKQIPELVIPVPVEEIALALDIEQIHDLDTDGFEGGLIAFSDKSSGTILVNKRSGPHRRRFTIGHELGHFLNPWHTPVTANGFRCTVSDMRSFGSLSRNNRAAQMEVEANRFSSGLLMPDNHFRKDIRQFGDPELEHILTLHERYMASKEATARKYVALHDQPCAVVFSRNGNVIYGLRGDDFPYLDVREGQPLPKQSVSARSRLGEGAISNWQQIDNFVWLTNPRNVKSLCEQTIRQQNGYRMTLLYAVLDDDEELRQRQTPKFRR